VVIKGGFAGVGEPNPDARDIELYETILSGDLTGNDIDVNDAWDVWRQPTFAENSYHIVTGSGTNSTAVLDGFTVTRGCANGPASGSYDDKETLLSSGAGMLNDAGSPTVINCIFRKNTTWTFYGQIDGQSGFDDGNPSLESTYIYLPETSGAAVLNLNSSPTFRNCIFEENVCFGADASSAGAGTCNINSSPLLENCVFRANVVTGFDSEYYGGAMANYNSSLWLRNCSFIENMAEFSYGGGIYSEESSLSLTGCTFRGNEVGGGSGGAIFVGGGNSALTECMFEENEAYLFGGGMCISDGRTTLTDCVLTNNSASEGGGVYSNFRNSLILRGCRFVGNSAASGGAVQNSGAWYNDPNSTTLITDCVFIANQAYLGGGIHNGWNRKNLTVVNCVFAGNSASNAGGGIYNDDCEQVLINCTFASNSASVGSAFASDLYFLPNPSSYQISNCIFWDGENGIRCGDDSAITITYSDVEGGWPGEGNIDADPCFVAPGYWDANGTPDDANDDFWLNGDYHLLDGSSCIDAGDNTAVPPSITTDLDGNLRIRGGIVDMGAYESRALFFVDIDATGANDGSSWADAYNYLQDALMMVSVGDEVRVAEGTYKPDQFVLSDRPNLGRVETFQLTNGVAIKGGYAGFGEPDPDVRDINVYKTVLSGDLNGDDVEVKDPCDLLTDPSRADNCYHVVTAIEIGYYGPDTNTILDGFTITGGNADGQEPDWELGAGGGMHNRHSFPAVLNCTFIENSARSSGGGIDNEVSWPSIINCTFRRNFSSWGGGLANGDCAPILIDCTFKGNVSSYKGGAMANYDGSPPMNNCSFIDNRAVLGGAIYGADCTPQPTDCTFTGNSAEKGGVVYNNDSSIILDNCKLTGNWATAGGVIYDDVGSSSLLNCVLNANTAITGGVIYSGDDSSARLTNCILSGNTAQSGGVAYICNDSNVKLIQCTLAANSADNGNALACDSYQQQNPSSVEVRNSILWDGGSEIWNNDSSIITITYSDVQGGWPGEGNIDADPLFVQPGCWDAGNIWIDGDYRLRAASPCIDAGTDAQVYEDIDGTIRPFDFPGVDNNGELPDFDMGAYEAVAMIQGELLVQPNKINRNARSQKIFAVIRLPEPIVGNDIDMSDPLVLFPGGIEADRQNIFRPDRTADESVRIRAVFDRAELLSATPYNGDVEVTVAGRFISGLYFYGAGTVTIK
jgi:predicted outer membrane repeat protein